MEPPKAARFRRALVFANPKAKLFDQVSEVCRLLHYSRRTEQTYVGWIPRFLVFHRAKAAGQWRHPRDLGGQEVTEFLSHLAVAEQVSASTQNQALNAVVFLYREVLHRELTGLDERLRATRPKRLPVVLTREEVLVEKEIGGGDGALEISVALVFSRRLTIKGGGFHLRNGVGFNESGG